MTQTQPPLTFSVWIAGIIARWRLVLYAIGATLLVAALAAVLLPPVYEAHASFVTTGSGSSRMSAAMGAASSAGLQGIASQFGLSTGADPAESPNFYVKLIQSEELRRRLLNSRFQNPRSANPRDSATLLDILRIRNDDPVRRMEIALKKMQKSIVTDFDIKTNVVDLVVKARWSDLAAAMANRTIQLVDSFNREQRVTRARSRRVFLQNRVDSARLELQQAEERQRFFYEQNRQWRSSPQLVFEEGQLRRNVDVSTDLYLQLQQQFEAARLDEINDAALITVVDPAHAPHKAQWPRYWLLLASALAVGTLIGIMVAGSATILADWRRRNPDSAGALSESVAALPFVGERRRRPRLS
ncbi:MAG TPA: GNVR domain-containing protein [Gemmatimonadaceae bacterium]|nr:GNVR domain-containing protein [Gemmatimonadaceae bacterium]